MKRIISTFFALTFLFSCCCSASASNIRETWASSTLSSYSAELYEGDSSGTLRVNFSVKSGHRADLIGITSIKIYKSNGTYVKTIRGSEENGLIRSNSNLHTGDYEIDLTSGSSFYIKATVFAEVGSDYDSRTIITKTVKVP